MKNFGKLLAVFMVALCSTFVFVSCKKSNEALINKYEELAKEIIAANKAGNTDKILSLSKECIEIGRELASRDLSQSEQKRIQDIGMELLQAGVSTSEANDILNKMSGDTTFGDGEY